MNEHALIRRLHERLGIRSERGVLIGIGDDAAVLAPSSEPAVISVDAQVEGVHFDRDWLESDIGFSDIGFRSYVSALSDLAAMGAAPRVGLLSWVLPPTLEPEHALEMADGVREAAALYASPVVGGNLSRGVELSLHTTVIGALAREAPWTRGGAEAGQTLYVSGPVGAAALGWRSLRAGRSAPTFVERWRRPNARFDAVRSGIDLAACIDVSDGLAADAQHIATASQVDLVIELSRVPTLAGHAELARALGVDPDRIALGGGEDYELLFTAGEEGAALGVAIGAVEPGSGLVRVLGRDGAPLEITRPGHDHFG